LNNAAGSKGWLSVEDGEGREDEEVVKTVRRSISLERFDIIWIKIAMSCYSLRKGYKIVVYPAKHIITWTCQRVMYDDHAYLFG
jgi:hypothetical protein